ncbi:MAG TPA: hypothetical protein DD726_10025 [Phycisphaerales bacterium]|nr:hypothetical protein [Phycisphaerales bacterium]
MDDYMIDLAEIENKLSGGSETVVQKPTQVALAKSRPCSDSMIAERCLKSLRLSRADDYQQWLEVGMALRSAGCDVSIWDVWSRQSSKYQENVCQIKWNSFNGDGKLTVASLVHWAKEDDLNYKPASAATGTGNLCFYPFTDAGNGERFAAMFRDSFRYNHSRGCWMFWDGQRWSVLKGEPEARSCFIKMCRELRREALLPENQERREVIERFARQSENSNRITNGLREAQHISPVSSYAEDFDRDPWLFNCLSGTIDLRTGRIRAHCPKDMITQVAPVYFDANAKCLRWDTFLREIMAGSDVIIRYIQRLFGMCLSGDVREQILGILFGPGANGKNKFLESITGLMGDYAGEAAPDLLIQRRNSEHCTEIADLCAKRLVVASETKDGEELKVAQVKRLTGNARIKARYMRQDFFEFDRTFKLVMMTNHKPVISEQTNAIWRRIRLIPFSVIIPKEKQDGELGEKLRAEWSGILNWLVQGCLDWQRNGLQEPDEIETATDEYRQEQAPLKAFFEERCSLSLSAICPVSRIREEYESWAIENGILPLTAKKFNDTMRSAGLVYDTRYWGGETQKVWLGIDLVFDESAKNKSDLVM